MANAAGEPVDKVGVGSHLVGLWVNGTALPLGSDQIPGYQIQNGDAMQLHVGYLEGPPG